MPAKYRNQMIGWKITDFQLQVLELIEAVKTASDCNEVFDTIKQALDKQTTLSTSEILSTVTKLNNKMNEEVDSIESTNSYKLKSCWLNAFVRQSDEKTLSSYIGSLGYEKKLEYLDLLAPEQRERFLEVSDDKENLIMRQLLSKTGHPHDSVDKLLEKTLSDYVKV